MLFLFNDRVIEIDLPELRLARRWRTLGCGDPHGMRARDAVEFARSVVDQAARDLHPLEEDTQRDIAALIVAKTGANAIQFVPRVSGPSEPRLSSIAEDALAAFRLEAERDEEARFGGAYSWSAA